MASLSSLSEGNLTEDSAVQQEGHLELHTWDYVDAALSFLYFLIGAPGNLLILRVQSRKSGLQKACTTDVFIRALAMCDLMSGVLRLVDAIQIWMGVLEKTLVSGVVLLFCSKTLLFTTASMTAVIAFDRYDTVCRHGHRRLSHRRAVIMSASCLAVSTLMLVPNVVDYIVNEVSKLRAVLVVTPILFYGLCLCTVVTFYLKLFQFVRQQTRTIAVRREMQASRPSKLILLSVEAVTSSACPHSHQTLGKGSTSKGSTSKGDRRESCSECSLQPVLMLAKPVSGKERKARGSKAVETETGEGTGLPLMVQKPRGSPSEVVPGVFFKCDEDDCLASDLLHPMMSSIEASFVSSPTQPTTGRDNGKLNSNSTDIPSRSGTLGLLRPPHSEPRQAPPTTTFPILVDVLQTRPTRHSPGDHTGTKRDTPSVSFPLRSSETESDSRSRRHFGQKVKCRQQKVTRMLLLATVAFFVLWSPYLAYETYSLLNAIFNEAEEMWQVHNPSFVVFSKLVFVNSISNPFIYSFANKRFRNECLVYLRNAKQRCWGCV